MPVQTIEPTTKVVVQFIDELKSGRYLLPSFQRSYVWDAEDVKELLRSMVDRIPIGVIVLWKASEGFTQQLPFARPLADVPGATPDTFVIDGQQRLTSLLLLFNDWSITRGGEPISIP